MQILVKGRITETTNPHRKQFSGEYSIIQYFGTVTVTVQPHGGASTTTRNTVLYVTSVPPDGASLSVYTSGFDLLFLPKPFTSHPDLPLLSPVCVSHVPLTCVSSIYICPSLSGTFVLRHNQTEIIVFGSLKSCI